MKIGSHNSWSFLKPRSLWMWPFLFMARCQSRSIRGQLDRGASLFDLRFYPLSDNEFEIRHGLMRYRSDNIESDLKLLSGYWVRLILEQPKKSKEQNTIDERFVALSNALIKKFPAVKFFGFYRKFDWKKLKDEVHSEVPVLVDMYSSLKSPKYLDDWCPFLYSWLNKKKIQEMKEKDTSDWLFIDFV